MHLPNRRLSGLLLRLITLCLGLATLCGSGCATNPAAAATSPTPSIAASQPASGAVPWPVDTLQPGEYLDADGNATRDGVPGRSAGWQWFAPVYAAGSDWFTADGAIPILSAARLDSGSPGGDGLSYAIYRLVMGGATPTYITINTLIPPGQSEGAIYYIGLADYNSGHWAWHGYQAGQLEVFVPSAGNYLSGLGNLFVAIVVYDGAALDCWEIGAHERLLTVGPGYEFDTPMEALAAADSGETILVFPLNGAVYEQVALFVEKPGLRFVSVEGLGQPRIKLSGLGYDYSGAGSIPRAIFQFQPGADGCLVQGFELYEAHNDSYNGAGVRINQANDVTVRDCEIHACDMGIMSNGDVAFNTGINQRIELCTIYENGNLADPGYNHNLYLGGTSVTVSGCEVYGSLTGHNVKSRAHFNRIEYCYVHDSANREFDLVDQKINTDIEGSHSVLIGNIIAKDPECTGNRAVIHYGQDGGHDHWGTLYLVNNTIATPFISPVVTLSAWHAGAAIHNNIITDFASGQNNQVLVAVSGSAELINVGGSHNWLANGQTIPPGTLIDDGSNYYAATGEQPPLVDALNADRDLRDYHPATAADGNIIDAGVDWATISIPNGLGMAVPGVRLEYVHPAGLGTSTVDLNSDRGAYETPHAGL